MGFETISQERGTGEKPENIIYYTYKMRDDGTLGANQKLLKKGDSVEGYYLNSYVPPKSRFDINNHVLVSKDNTHHVIPGGKDIDRDFASERCETNYMTRYEYIGKQSFETKSGGTASAFKCLLQQDKADKVEFIGDKYSARVTAKEGGAPAPAAKLNADDVPF